MITDLKIHLITEKDTQAVLDIYNYYVTNTIISFEYEVPTYSDYLQRIKTNTEKYPWLVCSHNDKVIGFAYGGTYRNRTAYQWSPELSIYIAPEFHTKGFGRVLYETLFSIMKLQGYYNAFAGIALPNEKSINFHKAMGFEEIGIFKNVGYKSGNWHHTFWFQMTLNEYQKLPTAPKKLEEIINSNELLEIIQSANFALNKINI